MAIEIKRVRFNGYWNKNCAIQ